MSIGNCRGKFESTNLSVDNLSRTIGRSMGHPLVTHLLRTERSPIGDQKQSGDARTPFELTGL